MTPQGQDTLFFILLPKSDRLVADALAMIREQRMISALTFFGVFQVF
jgi:hypothetical protein